MNKFVSQLFPGWIAEENYGFSPLGKIWMVLYPSLLITIISKSLQMISAEVSSHTAPQSKIFVSVIYASSDPAERSSLWTKILDLASTFSLDMKLWIIVGDFNQIRDPFEFSLMSTMNMDKRIRDFNQYLSNANLEDLNFRGTTFTWWNKRNLLPLAKRFDLCLVNDEW